MKLGKTMQYVNGRHTEEALSTLLYSLLLLLLGRFGGVGRRRRLRGAGVGRRGRAHGTLAVILGGLLPGLVDLGSSIDLDGRRSRRHGG